MINIKNKTEKKTIKKLAKRKNQNFFSSFYEYNLKHFGFGSAANK